MSFWPKNTSRKTDVDVPQRLGDSQCQRGEHILYQCHINNYFFQWRNAQTVVLNNMPLFNLCEYFMISCKTLTPSGLLFDSWVCIYT